MLAQWYSNQGWKKYELASNACVMFFIVRVKSGKIILCFVAKVRYVAILRFFLVILMAFYLVNEPQFMFIDTDKIVWYFFKYKYNVDNLIFPPFNTFIEFLLVLWFQTGGVFYKTLYKQHGS